MTAGIEEYHIQNDITLHNINKFKMRPSKGTQLLDKVKLPNERKTHAFINLLLEQKY